MIRNLSLRTKFLLGFIVPVLILVPVSVLGVAARNDLRQSYDRLADVDLPILAALQQMRFSSLRMISSANEYILDSAFSTAGIEDDNVDASEVNASADDAAETSQGRAEGELDQLEADIAVYEAAFQDYARLTEADVQSQGLVTTLQESGEAVVAEVTNIRAVVETGDLESIDETRELLETLEQEFLRNIEMALAEESAQVDETQTTIIRSFNESIYIVGVFGTLGLVLGGVFAFLLFRTITRRLSSLSTVAGTMRGGNMQIRAEVDSADEIGQFAQTFNSMADRVQGLIKELENEISVANTARAKAEESDRVKSAFLASMSHELRTPLNAVINFTKFVARGDLGSVNEEQKDTLNEVVDSGKHLLNLINDVLDMSKIESGSLNLFVTDHVNLSGILDQVISTGKVLLEDKPVELITEVERPLPTIRGDHQRIVQIFLNIMSNACKFTDTGSITLKARQQGDEIVVIICDTGQGIAPEDREAVFHAFKQTTSGLRQGGGTGLGMPITKSLVEAHGGRLLMESQPGVGTTFTVHLPVASSILVPTFA